jgi:hypothetical protein
MRVQTWPDLKSQRTGKRITASGVDVGCEPFVVGVDGQAGDQMGVSVQYQEQT